MKSEKLWNRRWRVATAGNYSKLSNSSNRRSPRQAGDKILNRFLDLVRQAHYRTLEMTRRRSDDG
ncbi:MAG: hypothetical protein WC765_02395 [Phycisphaerae bacterium]